MKRPIVLLPGQVRCELCRITAVTPKEGQRRICAGCDTALHRWNRKMYSSTPVIRGREYISRKK